MSDTPPSKFSAIKNITPLKAGWSLFDEFKSFAFKGNVVDLAVGVIIGAGFGKLVTSLVDNIIMPLVNRVTAVAGDAGSAASAMEFQLGEGYTLFLNKFLGDVTSFVIQAFILFILIVKFLGWVMKSRTQEVKAPPEPVVTREEVLLGEIRDLLAKKV